MPFEYLSASEIAELTEKQQERYFKEKKAHEDEIAKENAEKAAKAAADKAIEAYKESASKETQDAIDAAVKTVKDEYDKKIEKAQLEMGRAKEQMNKGRVDSLKTVLENQFEAEDAQKSWNEMRSGAKTGILSAFEAKAPAAFMPFPAAAGSDEWRGSVDIPTEPIHARNIIPVTTTSANAIKFVRWALGPDGNLINYVAQGGTKPKMEFIPSVVVENVVKVAGHITVADELFEDMEGARASIARMLPEALYDIEDAQILRTGTGGTTQLNSVWNTASAWVPVGSVTAASNVWDKLISAQTLVAKAKGRPTAAWVSPEAYQQLLINKDNANGYTYPIVMGNDNILRVGSLPVFYHNAFAAGEGVVGDFYATELFQKKAVEVRYSREHANNFTSNLTTVLVEVREALANYKPYSFIRLTNLVGSGS